MRCFLCNCLCVSIIELSLEDSVTVDSPRRLSLVYTMHCEAAILLNKRNEGCRTSLSYFIFFELLAPTTSAVRKKSG